MAKHTCRECGAPLASVKRTAVFCGTACRKTWNNRRMVRGAELYDLFMALRYQREDATQAQAFTMLANLARAYHDADVAKRDGRQSWNLREAMQRIPMAYSTDGDKR